MFSAFLQKHREYARGEGVNPVVYAFKNVGLSYCIIHETSLANNFYSTLLGRREGVCKKSTLCTFVIMLKIMDGP